MTLGSHQQTIGRSQVRITPRAILDPLGAFDLDPCGNDPRPWDCATVTYTEADNGLVLPWFGRVWLNPPFDRRIVGKFIDRLVDHGRGIALVHVRTETAWFEPIWKHASALRFLAGRYIFHNPDGSQCSIERPDAKHYGKAANSGAPLVLAAFGTDDADVLCLCGIAGHFVPLRLPRSMVVQALDVTWRDMVAAWLRGQRRPVSVAEIYEAFAGHHKTEGRLHWRAKLRQTLQRGAGRRVAHDRWVAAEASAFPLPGQLALFPEVSAAIITIPPSRSKAIVAEVALRHRVAVRDIMGLRKLSGIVAARNEAMYLLWSDLGWSLPRVGRFFGRDHTTVAYAIGSHTLVACIEPNWMSEWVIRHRARNLTRYHKRRPA